MTRSKAGLTRRLLNPGIGDLPRKGTYVFSSAGTEPRSRSPLWDECLQTVPNRCVEVIETTAETARVRIGTGSTSVIPVNDDSALMAVFQGDKCGYVDISGMPHHLWAALVRVGFQALDEFYAVYVEPNEYKRHPNPTSRSEFDLSDGFGGVKPLPGFVRLAGPEDERNAVLVAFLGFEGTRASLVAGTLDPVPKVVPVIGVPGFRCEYPQVAVASNEAFLAEYRAHNDVVFATASCPFEAFDALRNIRKDTGASYLYLATVGTKPHALGAVCYAIRHPKTSELMYDHPVRKAGRTGGVGPVHIYRMKPSHVSP